MRIVGISRPPVERWILDARSWRQDADWEQAQCSFAVWRYLNFKFVCSHRSGKSQTAASCTYLVRATSISNSLPPAMVEIPSLSNDRIMHPLARICDSARETKRKSAFESAANSCGAATESSQ